MHGQGAAQAAQTSQSLEGVQWRCDAAGLDMQAVSHKSLLLQRKQGLADAQRQLNATGCEAQAVKARQQAVALRGQLHSQRPQRCVGVILKRGNFRWLRATRHHMQGAGGLGVLLPVQPGL